VDGYASLAIGTLIGIFVYLQKTWTQRLSMVWAALVTLPGWSGAMQVVRMLSALPHHHCSSGPLFLGESGGDARSLRFVDGLALFAMEFLYIAAQKYSGWWGGGPPRTAVLVL